MMSLLLIAILTVASAGAAPIYCSDVQSPASGSHNTDLSQVISLQYCIIDNCTIMKIDTGEQLDIVYTTESLFIVTPIEGLTSTVIAKIDDELSCLKYSRTDGSKQIGVVAKLTFPSLIMMISIYIIIVHLLFTEFHTMFGILIIFHNLCIVFGSIGMIPLLLMHHLIVINSQMICYTLIILFMISSTAVELFATTILTHLAYCMYRCYHLKSEISDKNVRLIFRCYIAYVLITLILLLFLITAYDWRTGNGKLTLLPNGHCNFVDQYSYPTLFLTDVVKNLNKFIQLIMVFAYLYYFYKLKVEFRDAQNLAKYSKRLLRVAIVMGANVGLSRLFWLLLVFESEYSNIFNYIGPILFLIQQVLIMSSFTCTRKMSELCKAYFSRD